MNELLQIKNLSIGFPKDHTVEWEVKDIDLHIEHGETLALVGESGGGKTLTALSIMQLLPNNARVSQQSQIIWKQKELLSLSEAEMSYVRGKQIAMVFQDAMIALNPVLTIEQQIEEILLKHFSLNKKQRHQRMLQLLADVGLMDGEHILAAYPHQLSGGMRQRAMIAMALAGEPELLIADEPTSALDVGIQKQIVELLKEIQIKKQMSLLFIAHDLALVAQIADRVAVIHHGKIIEQADAKNFFAKPSSDYSRQLFSAIPTWQNRQRSPLPHPTGQPLLNVEDLKIYFPIHHGIFKRTVGYVKAVDNINLTLYQGRTLALVGESGSGKSTVGKAILRLIKPTAGKIEFESYDLAKLSTKKLHQARRNLQIVFQDPFSSMNPRMLVSDIIAEGMQAQHLYNKAQRSERIAELLRLVDLPVDSQWRYPHEFSGGQRQRICIARSLALNPEVLICDEATSSLDVSVQMQVLQLLQRLQQELQLSYLLITHNFGVVAYMADDVAVMQHGKIVEYGPVENILQNPQHSYTKELLAAVPQLPAPVQ
jgi:peptide/nickel transport system ATP-binding protein